MKENKFKIYLVIILSAFISHEGFAQSNTVAAGGEATGSGGKVSYSIGQIDYITATGSNGIATEGVQQPYEIYPVGLEEVRISLEMTVYPNPARDILNLNIAGYQNEKLSFKIYSADGKLVMDQQILSAQTRVNLSGLALSTYVLQVTEEGKEVKTFKIIKNI